MDVELPIVTIVPPASANFLSSGKVLSVVIEPSQPRNSAGIFSGLGCCAEPRPRPDSVNRADPSGNTSTSNFALRLPASSICG